jgi:hypothetical protein
MFTPYFTRLLVLSAVVSAYILIPVAHANSLEVDGPGFKMANKTGWFGRHSTTYTDMLGNKVDRSTGIFGRTTTKTRVLGTETYKRGQNISVTAPSGTPLISTKKTWLGGRQTHVSGNGIIESFKGLFNNKSQTTNP